MESPSGKALPFLVSIELPDFLKEKVSSGCQPILTTAIDMLTFLHKEENRPQAWSRLQAAVLVEDDT